MLRWSTFIAVSWPKNAPSSVRHRDIKEENYIASVVNEIGANFDSSKKESVSGLFAVIPAEDGCLEHKKGKGTVNLALNGKYLPGLNERGEVLVKEPYAEVSVFRRRKGRLIVTINKVDPHSEAKTNLFLSGTQSIIEFEGEESAAEEEINEKVDILLSTNGLTRFELAVQAAITRSKLDITKKEELYFYEKK